VDFDDLIRLALTLLENDPAYLERLRYRYPYILEDEAQDSSRTQERILSLLSGEDGNWVRVGDPNQAIFETFTTADPELLRAFIRENLHLDMPESGRSQPSIIALANYLIDWVMQAHPDPQARTALSPPHIQPVPPGYQPVNPPDDPAAVRLIPNNYTPEEELEAVVKSVKAYLDSLAEVPEDEKPTIAILVPRNQRGVEVIDALKRRGVEPLELVSSTSETRATAGSLNHLLAYLADPQSARKLAKAYEVWRRDWRIESQKMELVRKVESLLRHLNNVEDYIAPRPDRDWLASLRESESEEVVQELEAFRINLRRWLAAVTLPIDQLILTLAQDVFTQPSELALTHKLALVLRQASDEHSHWCLPELTSELAVIARNERRFIGFSTDDSGFDPEQHRGKVVVTTMHRAKGLEWDRVYLMSVNDYDFPSNQQGDRFISEKWFVRGGLNLEAEVLAQLDALESNDEYAWYNEGAATAAARLDYARERLRLLYVGITRARQELIITWNTGRQGDAQPARALVELMKWWEARRR
jgi:DNA helicase-2/ATP-dependent DNA helicase PcrA